MERSRPREAVIQSCGPEVLVVTAESTEFYLKKTRGESHGEVVGGFTVLPWRAGSGFRKLEVWTTRDGRTRRGTRGW
ncbi:hypothetical protein NDU88_004655 [Pleurodeles waltl]|uniref:Uncharacterized protein n=1 Tax=Pleurodeles waltl TaxID=8319 RepID=A0AAV7LV93_PLEWA|nr:hypothetical protein NDU88_004655 [Pleurodeles waltl]